MDLNEEQFESVKQALNDLEYMADKVEVCTRNTLASNEAKRMALMVKALKIYITTKTSSEDSSYSLNPMDM